MKKQLPESPVDTINQLWDEPDTVYFEQVELAREEPKDKSDETITP